MRADQLLVERGLAASRSQAQRLIAAGVRWSVDGANWRAVAKNGDELPAQARVELLDDAEARFVSRGGLKLAGALAATGLVPAGWRCLDVGQSTGGFTECLLAHGAAAVVGVDVGHGQVHERVRGDARVTCIEGVNARALTADDLGGQRDFDLAVGDLSFISLTLVLPAVVPLVRRGGCVLMLVKPQFELSPGEVGRGGVVRDASLYPRVRARIEAACAAAGLTAVRWLDSPIAGGDGNREFFVCAMRS